MSDQVIPVSLDHPAEVDLKTDRSRRGAAPRRGDLQRVYPAWSDIERHH